ncbi:MAG: hypothetical protein NC396_05110 [Bacteroides sp.]|nr:hypothetical protein [Bacteroides sp.]MCM1085738.1 hypothetical protein [Bacteroides sp.]
MASAERFPIGSILLIHDYHLPTATKDKFFIVLGTEGDNLHLLSMTTSKIYFDAGLLRHGLIVDRDMSVYCFEQGRKIGEKGFCFHKHTIISHRSNVHRLSPAQLASYEIKVCDRLVKQELIELLYSFFKYRGTKNKDRRLFESLLDSLSLPNDIY